VPTASQHQRALAIAGLLALRRVSWCCERAHVRRRFTEVGPLKSSMQVQHSKTSGPGRVTSDATRALHDSDWQACMGTTPDWMAERFTVRGSAADSVAEYLRYRQIVGDADGGVPFTDKQYLVSAITIASRVRMRACTRCAVMM